MLLETLPTWAAVLVPELSLLVIGYVVEKHYVSRVTCFTNALALNVHFLTAYDSGFFLGLYADLGLGLGALGILAYWERESLGEWYYQISHIGYSSIVVGAVLLYPHIESAFGAILVDGSIPAIGVVLLAVLFNLAILDESDRLHYRLAKPIGVNEFILQAQIRVPTEQGMSPFIDLAEWFEIE